MNSHTVADFWQLFAALPADAQRQAYKTYQQFRQDPFHPSLHFKEVDKRQDLWSVRVGKGYRALGYRRGGDIRWIWIGTHAEYDALLARH